MPRRFIERLVVGSEPNANPTGDNRDEPSNVGGDVPQDTDINLEEKKMLPGFARIEIKRLKLNHQEDDKGEPLSVGEDDQSSLREDASQQDDNEASSNSGGSLATTSSPPTAMELALENPVILHHLFQVCPAPILASCRLLSKLWFEESLVTWRKAFPITIRPPLTEFLEFNNEPGNHCSTKPFRNIRLIKGQFALQSEEYGIFQKSIGSHLTTLSLYSYRFNNVAEFRQILYKCCPVLQNLGIFYCYFFTPSTQITSGRQEDNKVKGGGLSIEEHKHLKSLDVQFGQHKFPVTWTEVFSQFPFLTSFQTSCHREADLEILMDAIRIVRVNDKGKLPFKSFEFWPTVIISREPESHRKCVLIKELRLPLTNVCIEIHPELEHRFVRSMLEYLAPSVKSIILGQEDEDLIPVPTWFSDFPFGIQLNNLTKFQSIGDFLRSFAFLRCMPSLVTLDISESHYLLPGGIEWFTTPTTMISNTCREELANVQLLGLMTLRLGYIVSDEDIQGLFNWMPNITKLEMVLDDKQFEMVCQNWKNVSVGVLGNRREPLKESPRLKNE